MGYGYIKTQGFDPKISQALKSPYSCVYQAHRDTLRRYLFDELPEQSNGKTPMIMLSGQLAESLHRYAPELARSIRERTYVDQPDLWRLGDKKDFRLLIHDRQKKLYRLCSIPSMIKAQGEPFCVMTLLIKAAVIIDDRRQQYEITVHMKRDAELQTSVSTYAALFTPYPLKLLRRKNKQMNRHF